MPHDTPQTRYDPPYVAARLARAVGQLRQVKSMVETGADCTELLIQLAAARGQLDGVYSLLLQRSAESFAEEYRRTGDRALLDDFKTQLHRAVKK